MLVPIAIDLSLNQSETIKKHDFGDATALVHYITNTPCILLHDGESFEKSQLYSLLGTLQPKVRTDLIQCFMKMPTFRVADWDGKCGKSLPPYSYLRSSILAVPRDIFESHDALKTLNDTVTIHAGVTDITMWHTIPASRVHQQVTKIHKQHVEKGTPREELWGKTFEPLIQHAKIRSITIIDRYAFKIGSHTDTSATAIIYFLDNLQKQSKNRDDTIAVTIIIQADKYHDDEVDKIVQTLAKAIHDKPKITSLHICAMSKHTMQDHYHERFIYTETYDGILYEAMIGRGVSVFASPTVFFASILTHSFHWIAGESTLYSDAKKRTSSLLRKQGIELHKVLFNYED